jgi:hypothetical protein
MSDASPPIFAWLKEWWQLLAGLALIVGGVVRTAFFLGSQARKLRFIGENQDKILHIIPVDALEKGLMLQTVNDCNDRRANCGINKVVRELHGDVKKLMELKKVSDEKFEKALTTLINRIPDLKSEDREQVQKEMI